MKSVKIEKERYYDSVFLMRISDAVQGLPGIADAVVALATPTNVENLEKIAFSSPELSAAGPNDLVIAIDAADEDALSAALARVEELLREKVEETERGRSPSGDPGKGAQGAPRCEPRPDLRTRRLRGTRGAERPSQWPPRDALLRQCRTRGRGRAQGRGDKTWALHDGPRLRDRGHKRPPARVRSGSWGRPGPGSRRSHP